MVYKSIIYTGINIELMITQHSSVLYLLISKCSGLILFHLHSLGSTFEMKYFIAIVSISCMVIVISESSFSPN